MEEAAVRGVYRAPPRLLIRYRLWLTLPVLVAQVAFVGFLFRRTPVVVAVFAPIWSGGVGWMIYRSGYRLAMGAALTPDALQWRGKNRSGQIPLRDLTNVRQSWFGSNTVVLEHRNGALPLACAPGLIEFLQQLSWVRPDLPIRADRAIRRIGRYRFAYLGSSWWHPGESADQL